MKFQREVKVEFHPFSTSALILYSLILFYSCVVHFNSFYLPYLNISYFIIIIRNNWLLWP